MARNRLESFLRVAFKIEEGEMGKTAWMFFYQFSVVGAFVIGRITAATLFVTEWELGLEYLAHMYYVGPLAVSGAAYIYSRFADQIRRDKLIIGTTIMLVVGVFSAAVIGGRHLDAPYYIGLYIFVEIMGMFLTLQFWTFANDVIDSRQGKRLFGVIASGGVAGSIVAGQLVRLKKVLGVSGLLYISAALLIGCVLAVYVVGRANRASLNASLHKPRRASQKKGIKVAAEGGRILSSTYLKLIGLMVLATFLTTPLIDYQWKVAAKTMYPTKEGYSAFQGNFYTMAGVLSFFFQVFFTRRILKRFGIFIALLFLPLGILSGTLFNIVTPALFAVTLAKGSETTFRYTINDSTVALLYLPIPAHQRGRVKAFIDGIAKNWAIAIFGLVLAFVIKPLVDDPFQLSYVAIITLGAWLLSLVGIKREYLDTLLSSLKGRSLDLSSTALDVGDESTARAVRRALQSDDEGQILRALDILPQLRELRFDDDVAALLSHSSNAVQMASVREIGRIGSLRHAAAVKRLFEDDDELVRASAIDAYCAIGREKAIRDVTRFLEDESPAIKSAAIVGLIKYGGLDGILCAAEELKKLIHHGQPEMRLHAAEVLGAIGVRNFYQPLLGLLSDPVRGVQIAAIRAAGQMRSPELIPALIMKLRRRASARVATEALASYGAGVEPLLGKVLRFKDEDPDVRSAAPAILARIGTQEACDVLLRALGMEENNPHLRFRIHRALARMVHRNPGLKVDRKWVTTAALRELRYLYQELQLTADLGSAAEYELLREALENRRRTMLQGVFHLLAVLYVGGQMETVYANLGSPTPAVRSNALEVIDNLVEKGLREHIINLIEARSLEEQLELGEELGVTEKQSRNYRLEELLEQEDPWVVAAALDAIVHIIRESHQTAEPELVSLVHEAATREDSLVRQTSLWALAQVAPRDGKVLRSLREHAGENEPDDIVRDYARATLSRLSTALDSGATPLPS